MHPLCCSAKFRGLKTPVYLVHSTASSKTPKPPQPHPKISCLTCGTSFLYYSASPKSPESRGLLFQGKQKSFLMGSDLGQVEVSQWQILLSDLWLNSGFRFFFFYWSIWQRWVTVSWIVPVPAGNLEHLLYQIQYSRDFLVVTFTGVLEGPVPAVL